MPNAIEEFFNKILSSILHPILTWILKLSWLKRFIIVMTMTLVGCGIYWHNETSELVANFNRYLVILTNPPSKIPLSAEKQIKLDSIIKKINNTLLSLDYIQKTPYNDRYNSWTISQIIVSTNSDSPKTLKESYTDFILHSPTSVKKCNCWSEFRESSYGHHVVTSWVMLAHSKLDMKLNDSLIKYVLDSQDKDGWWGLFPCKKEEDASTYATAYFILALNKSLNNKSLDKNTSEKIRYSIDNGIKWLESKKGEGKTTLWYDYPNSNDKKQIIGINGFTLHVLNELEPNKGVIKSCYSKWLLNFDNYRIKCLKDSGSYDIKYSNQSGHTIEVENAPSVHDMANIYNLPWFIIASVDLYPHASLLEKAKILKFLEEIIEQGDDLYEETTGTPGSDPWIACEFLIALRKINNEKGL